MTASSVRRSISTSVTHAPADHRSSAKLVKVPNRRLLEALENRQLFAAISGTVFQDLNSSAQQDTGDTGFAGAAFQLQSFDGSTRADVGAPVTSDANGEYTINFTADPGLTYRVQYLGATPNGFDLSRQDQGDDTIDSDFNGSGRTSFQAIADTETLDFDLGLTPNAQALRLQVWFDENGDGIQDSAELSNRPATTGVNYEIRSVGPDGLWNTADDLNLNAGANRIFGDGDDQVFQSGNQGFGFINATIAWPAAYQVFVDPSTLPAGYELTAIQAAGDDAADSDIDPATGFSRVFTIDTWNPDPGLPQFPFPIGNIDIGLKPKSASVSGIAFGDTDGSGLQDNGETGLAGVGVTLLDDTDTVVGTATTAVDGSYRFAGLSAGDYRVSFDLSLLTDKAFTTQDAGGPSADTLDSDVDPATGLTDLFTVGVGQDVTDIDAGVVDDGPIIVNGQIEDRVFLDANGNGRQDAGELGVAGVTVELLDATSTVVDTTTTLADGSYRFVNVLPADYRLRFDISAAPGFAIGYVFATQNVGDTIPGDALASDDSAVDSDVDATGLTDVITLGNAETRAGIAAGLVALPGSITGRVWLDTNRNSQQDVDETAGLGGITVSLLNSSLSVIDSTLTLADGTYAFTGLEAGNTYRVQIEFADLPGGSEFSLANVGDDNLDSDFTAVSNPVGAYFAQDFIIAGENTVFDVGVRDAAATLSTRVFEDFNRNGLSDDATGSFSGVRVVLMGVGADGVFGTSDDLNVRLGPDGVAGTTDDPLNTGGLDGIFGNADDDTSTVFDASSAGSLAFFDLNPGDYQLLFDAASLPSTDYELTLVNVSGGIDDSDADPITGLTPVFSLVSGEVNNSLQAGFRLKPAQIGGTLFVDANRNGLQDPGETGLAGETVELIDDLGNVVNTRVSDANGDYLFEDEDPNAAYALRFDRSVVPAGFGFTEQDAGGPQDDTIDSDANPGSGETALVFYNPGDSSLDVSAGVSEVTGSIDVESTVFAPTVAVERVIDFDTDAAGAPLAAGDDPSAAYQSIGLTITSAKAQHPPMIFDSANPTGGDWDLQTPGWHPSNQTPEGNILILSEDGDASDPDDNRRGGTLIFTFDEAVQLRSLSLLDNQSRRTKIQIFAGDGSLLRSISIPKGQNNAIQQVDLNTDNAAYMTVKLGGSGAITELVYNQAQYGAVDADAQPGPTLVTGGTASLTYTVTNTGDNVLTGLVVTDELGAADATQDDNGFNTGDLDLDGVFDPGEAWVFSRQTTVADGANSLTASVSAMPVNPFAFTGFTVSDTDATHFVGGLSETPGDLPGVDELEPVYVLAGYLPGTHDPSAGEIASVDTWYDSVLNELGFRAAFADHGQVPDVVTLSFAAGTAVITINATDANNPIVTVTDAVGAPLASSLIDDELILDIDIEDTTDGRVIALTLNTESLTTTGFGETVDLNLTTYAGSTTAYAATTGALTSLASLTSGGLVESGLSAQSASAADAGAIQQRSDGVVMIDAADPDSLNSRWGSDGWQIVDQAGDTGAGSLTTNNWWRRIDRRFTQRSPQATYTVNFEQAGTYYVWIRGSAPDSGSNSLHVGLNGQAVSTADRLSLETTDGSFAWTNTDMDGQRVTITVTEAGLATIDLWMREDGFTVDSIYLTQDAADTPSGSGPVANLRVTPDTGLNLRLVNIGDPLLSGSISVDDNGVITLTGAGSNIGSPGSANDAFTFAGTQVTGDFEMVAEFVDFQQAEYWSQTGLMARESFDSDSAYAFAAMNGGNQTAFEFRDETGGNSEYDWTAQTNGKVWMKLVREGDVFTTYHSNDGTTWSAVASHTLDLVDQLWLGLAIVSHDEDEIASAQFANVTINGQAIA